MYLLRLEDLRRNLDLTQQDICKLLKIKQPQYSRYENGDREIPLKYLIKLSQFYKVSVDYILGLTNNKKRNY